ncbi:unnamed protein product [Mytilus edulis]|uniref:Uncharacterized protein n=1 Tax=Mytilus edulis TaxID=6550 RepID=A0A8S3QUI1_MYTED|nr:unnamed protein product [Mytilus edulis]
MFVMEDNDIKDIAVAQYECFGIVIPNVLLQQYIERLFDNLTSMYNMHYLNDVDNRPLMNVLFRRAVRCHMRQLQTEKIASIIQTAGDVFLNTMFVKTDNDIDVNTEKGYKCFSIVIPDDLLQQYIIKWFGDLTTSISVKDDITENKLLGNVAFRNAVRNHMNQLTTKQIALIFQTAGNDFFNTMFVRSENNIKDKVENRHECFGIVIPDDLVQQYIIKWFDQLATSGSVRDAFNENRPLINGTFRCEVRNHMNQQTTEQIASIIRRSGNDFLIQCL